MFYFACEHNTQIKKGLKNTTSTSEVANLLLMLNYSRSLTQLTSHTAIVVRILSVQHEHQEPSEIYSYLITRQLLRRYRDQREQRGKLASSDRRDFNRHGPPLSTVLFPMIMCHLTLFLSPSPSNFSVIFQLFTKNP